MRLATSAWWRALAIGTVAVMLAACAATVPREPPDRAFTMAVLPDTQNYMDYTHQKAEGFPFDASEQFMAADALHRRQRRERTAATSPS